MKGDGQTTIWNLVERENEHRRHHCGFNSLKPVYYDRDAQATLEAQGLSRGSIPGDGKEVLVKSYDHPSSHNAEIRTVYNEGVTDHINQDVRRAAVHAAQILQSQFAGVDIITLDPTVSLADGGGIINEVNTTPGLHHHYNLTNEQDSAAAVHVLKHLLKIDTP